MRAGFTPTEIVAPETGQMANALLLLIEQLVPPSVVTLWTEERGI